MKRILNASLLSLAALAVVTLCGGAASAQSGGAASAQIRDARVVRARAGGVNFVSGDVSVRPADGKDWAEVTTSDELKTGDEVRTGADGRVEVLLNPGSYFRAGGATRFTMADASLEDLRVSVTRGSAVVEATGYGFGGSDLSITVETPRTVVRIIRSGVYRVDVSPSGVTEVAVIKGRAFVGTVLVKAGKVAREGAYGVEVAKLEKKDRDPLEQWSRDRGKELAKANEKLNRRGIYTSLASLSGYGGRYGYGVWLWNQNSSCYTFLPFNTYYWQSPYGFWYGTGAYFYPGTGYGGGGNFIGGTNPAPNNSGNGNVGAAAPGGKPMPERGIQPPREMPREQPREMPPPHETITPVREAMPVQQSMPMQQSMPSPPSAPARAMENTPQQMSPPE
ncbi:MAG TPA: FecR domain-containing protein [Pyrinomonadaceae bacterium]|nr:FecR domain-containing protein [Pyrinomonadaceae bacterium]